MKNLSFAIAIFLKRSLELGNAVSDISCLRRKNPSILFLRLRKPYIPIKTWSAHSIVHRNAAYAGITWPSDKRKGVHSFRQTIVNWMLEAEIPLEMITEILGQSNTDSTRPYIAVYQP